MKMYQSCALAVALALVGVGGVAWGAESATVITVDTNKVRFPTAPDLWGIFFEDIDLSLDGGVYAELVRNCSFEDVDPKNVKTPAAGLGFWERVGAAKLTLDKSRPFSAINCQCGKVEAEACGGVANAGYFGISVKAGAKYRLSVALCGAVKGPIAVTLEADGKPAVGEVRINAAEIGPNWQTHKLEFTATGTEPQARLVFRALQGGTFYLDCVSLFPEETYGKTGLFRKDLMERLAALKPAFVRFPGGSWVNGHTLETGYLWKTTIGPIWERKTQWNIWGYTTTHAVGFHEYLLLCEELKAKPLFCCYCGVDCNMRAIPMDKMGPYVQDVLDAIEYANGPVTSTWGRKRAEAGHPAPFNLEYLEIGNELRGKVYEERYALIHDAVQAKYPEIKLLSDATNRGGGTFSHGAPITGRPQHIRDEHYYKEADWYFSQGATCFDTWPRGKFEVFVGEYACCAGAPKWGDLRGAISEAAFMLNFERNQDLVKLAAYAPLFANRDHMKWKPNLIYVTSNSNFVNPSWNVQKLFAENHGTQVLDLSVKTETFKLRWGDAPKVQASAVRDADGSVILKVVNATETPQSFTTNLKGRTTKTVFTGPNRSAHNSVEAPDGLKEVATQIDFTGADTLPPLSLTIYRVR